MKEKDKIENCMGFFVQFKLTTWSFDSKLEILTLGNVVFDNTLNFITAEIFEKLTQENFKSLF